jgi:hypothetical protein
MRPLFFLATAGVLLASGLAAAAETPFRIARFQADVSPPIGQTVDIGFRQATTVVEHPALLKGLVLDSSDGRFVLAAIDYTGLCNSSYERLRERIAKAAGTRPDRVALQALHQHTTVCLDAEAARILYRDDPQRLQVILDFENDIGERAAKAVTAGLREFVPVTHVGLGQARVERVASSRRLRQPDGKVITRLSATRDPTLRALPEGLIDPWLRTISFHADERPLAHLHYYATHPQSFYSDNRCTWDVPGIARERLQEETGVFQVYFTGCGGNIAMGKYNDGTLAARAELAERLYQGMRAALANVQRHPASRLAWRTEPLKFPLRTDASFTADTCRATLADARQSFNARLRAAMCLAWIERVKSGRPVATSSLSGDRWSIVHLPGEPFVQFQLAAQRMQPNRSVFTAGYGDCAMWYLGPDEIYRDQGGYEQSWAFAGPCEELLMKTLRQLLAAGSATSP